MQYFDPVRNQKSDPLKNDVDLNPYVINQEKFEKTLKLGDAKVQLAKVSDIFESLGKITAKKKIYYDENKEIFVISGGGSHLLNNFSERMDDIPKIESEENFENKQKVSPEEKNAEISVKKNSYIEIGVGFLKKIVAPVQKFVVDSVQNNMLAPIVRNYGNHSAIKTIKDLQHVDEAYVIGTFKEIKTFIELSKDPEIDPKQWKENAQEMLKGLEKFKTSLASAKIGMDHLCATYKNREENFEIPCKALYNHGNILLNESIKLITDRLNELEMGNKTEEIESQIPLEKSFDESILEERGRNEPVLEERIFSEQAVEESNPGGLIEKLKSEGLNRATAQKYGERNETIENIENMENMENMENEITPTFTKGPIQNGAALVLEHFPETAKSIPELSENSSLLMQSKELIIPHNKLEEFRIFQYKYLLKIADGIVKEGGIKKIDEKINVKLKKLSKLQDGLELETNKKALDRLVFYREAAAYLSEHTLKAKHLYAKEFILRLDKHVKQVFLNSLNKK